MITQASIEQSLKPSEAHAQRQRIADYLAAHGRCIMTAHITLTASTYGIVQASFSGIGVEAIKTAQDAIIDDLKALVRHGRAQLHQGSYTPQRLPIMWWVGLADEQVLDFGVMIDAVACDESTIDRRADEIIAKLCRDCQMIGGLV